MSEELVIDYLKAGYKVFLYGFGGSTQLNLDGIKNVHNCLFESEYISNRMNNGYTLFHGDHARISLSPSLVLSQ